MKNYIVSTDVGGAEDVLDYTGGVVFNQNNEDVYNVILGELQRLAGTSDYDLNRIVLDNDRELLSWENLLSNTSFIEEILR